MNVVYSTWYLTVTILKLYLLRPRLYCAGETL